MRAGRKPGPEALEKCICTAVFPHSWKIFSPADRPDSLLYHPSTHSHLPKPPSLSNSKDAFNLVIGRRRGKINLAVKEGVWENICGSWGNLVAPGQLLKIWNWVSPQTRQNRILGIIYLDPKSFLGIESRAKEGSCCQQSIPDGWRRLGWKTKRKALSYICWVNQYILRKQKQRAIYYKLWGFWNNDIIKIIILIWTVQYYSRRLLRGGKSWGELARKEQPQLNGKIRGTYGQAFLIWALPIFLSLFYEVLPITCCAPVSWTPGSFLSYHLCCSFGLLPISLFKNIYFYLTAPGLSCSMQNL